VVKKVINSPTNPFEETSVGFLTFFVLVVKFYKSYFLKIFMKNYLFLAFAAFAVLVTAGGSCGNLGGTDTNSYNDTYAPYDYGDGMGDTYDYDPYGSDDPSGSYSNIPQGVQTIYACNMDQNSCEYIEVNISGDTISWAYYGSETYYPNESLCDADGCYFVNEYTGDEWYFEL
jgi:hypothetical protein